MFVRRLLGIILSFIDNMSLLEDAEVFGGRTSVTPVYPSFKNITQTTIDSPSSAYSGIVKSGAGFLGSIIINSTAAGTVTIYDGIKVTGATKIGVMKASIAEGVYQYNCKFTTGLFIITGTNTNLTAIYR